MKFIGLMSGTSLDGVDGVVADFSSTFPKILAHTYVPFCAELRSELLALQMSGPDEIHREALAANALAHCYAACCQNLIIQMEQIGGPIEKICAIGAHGQTIRHQPKIGDGLGYTRQINNPALLAELTGIDVIADFRSRDIAAGGQGAPLVPLFHEAVFGPLERRVICNIGGISNLTLKVSKAKSAKHGDDVEMSRVIGFDCGPGNVLLDLWAQRNLGKAYDEAGHWARQGQVNQALLADLLNTPFFDALPPKSTGRDQFNEVWLTEKLKAFHQLQPVDIQATLLALTVAAIVLHKERHAPDAAELFVCGGGAHNQTLISQLAEALKPTTRVATCQDLDISPEHVEALAFAWLAQKFCARESIDFSQVTGASGPRILGALYPGY